jgi:hypothetical protein
MVKRRELKHVHEGAVLHQFSAYVEKLGSTLKILNNPDPPDAIIEINGQKTWIEITDAFLDRDHAIRLTTGASEDVEHRSDPGRLVLEPDERFSSALRSVIEDKYDKKTMRSISQIQGAGILLVGIFTPFASASDIAKNEAVSIANLVAQKPIKVFDTVYVYDGAGQRSFHLIYSEIR